MKSKLFILFVFLTNSLVAQEVASYYFNNNLLEYTTKYPPLNVNGKLGKYVTEVVPKLGNKARQVYQFEKNSGLNFDYSHINNFIQGSYAIEMYFRYDNADLFIYSQLIGNRAASMQNKYVHLVTTRDAATKKVNVFVDGKVKLQFIDTKDELALDKNANINFFIKEGTETTSGAAAMIKIYNFFIDEDMGKNYFEPFIENEAKEIDISAKSYTLNKLYFVQSESTLLPESTPEIERLVKYLQENNTTKILLLGHTDNQGDFNLNLKLSRERAESVKKLLLENGIAAERIQTKGYGSTRPVASNASEQTRRFNRRVEMEVLNK